MDNTKELWKMDYEEFKIAKTKSFEEGYGKPAEKAYEEFIQQNPDKAADISIDIFLGVEGSKYKEVIHHAVKNGKAVPDDILAIYPDLAKDKPELLEIKINRKVLLSALTNINPIISGGHTLAILSSILINTKEDNTIEIIATNLETGFQGVYPAQVISQGSITMPHKELSNFVSKIKSDEICITEKEKRWVNISGDSTTCNIVCMDADDFPMLPEEINCKKEIEIDTVGLKNMIAKAVIVHPECENDTRKMHIMGAFFKVIEKDKQDFLQMASTNGAILAQVNEKIFITKETGIEKGILIPKSELIKLDRAFLKDAKNKKQQKNKGFELFESSSEQTISLAIQGSFFIAQKQNETIIIRLLDGEFPDYQDIINSEKNKFQIKVNREILLDSMRQMASMQNEIYKVIEMNIQENTLEMSFTNPDIGEMKKEIPIQYNGDLIKIAFRPNYFIDFLKLMKSDTVRLDIIDREHPCFITGDEDPKVIFLIMPYKI